MTTDQNPTLTNRNWPLLPPPRCIECDELAGRNDQHLSWCSQRHEVVAALCPACSKPAAFCMCSPESFRRFPSIAAFRGYCAKCIQPLKACRCAENHETAKSLAAMANALGGTVEHVNADPGVMAALDDQAPETFAASRRPISETDTIAKPACETCGQIAACRLNGRWLCSGCGCAALDAEDTWVELPRPRVRIEDTGEPIVRGGQGREVECSPALAVLILAASIALVTLVLLALAAFPH